MKEIFFTGCVLVSESTWKIDLWYKWFNGQQVSLILWRSEFESRLGKSTVFICDVENTKINKADIKISKLFPYDLDLRFRNQKVIKSKKSSSEAEATESSFAFLNASKTSK